MTDATSKDDATRDQLARLGLWCLKLTQTGALEFDGINLESALNEGTRLGLIHELRGMEIILTPEVLALRATLEPTLS